MNNEVDNGLSDGVVTFSARIVITIIIHSLNVPIKRLPEDTYVLLVCVLLLLGKKKKRREERNKRKEGGQGSYCNQVTFQGLTHSTLINQNKIAISSACARIRKLCNASGASKCLGHYFSKHGWCRCAYTDCSHVYIVDNICWRSRQ